jgi:hypothetical protein
VITGPYCVLRQPKTQGHAFRQLALVSVPVAQGKPSEIRAPWPPLCVLAARQRPGNGVHDGDGQAHHAEAGPGLEGAG